MRRVLVPAHPGLLSAWGAATADLQRDYVQTVRLADPEPRELARRLRPLELRARRELRAEGAAPARIRTAAVLDVRYHGQSYELRVPMSARFRAAFHAAHRAHYGYADEERALEVVNLRVIATAGLSSSVDSRASLVGTSARPPSDERRSTSDHRLRWNGRWVRALRCDRSALRSGRRLLGPLVITELSATTLVPPGWVARVTPRGDLLLDAKR
jgi:N-methylhydantoinase A